jgi:uncharacterized protein (TIRG00374 family)
MVGFASNNLLPARIGELLRVYLASREFGLPTASVLATIVLERLFDLLSVLFFTAVVVLISEDVPTQLRTAVLLIGIVAGVSVGVMVALMGFGNATRRGVPVLFGFLPASASAWLERQLALVQEGLSSLKAAHLTYRILVNSLVQWGFMVLCIWFAILAFDAEVPVTAPFVVLALVVAGITLPSAPGFIGVIEYCFVLGLQAFGVDPSVALGAALFYHVLTWISVTMAGVIFARRYGRGFSSLRESVGQR